MLSPVVSRDFSFLYATKPSIASPASQPKARPDCHLQTIPGLPPLSSSGLLILSAQSSKASAAMLAWYQDSAEMVFDGCDVVGFEKHLWNE